MSREEGRKPVGVRRKLVGVLRQPPGFEDVTHSRTDKKRAREIGLRLQCKGLPEVSSDIISSVCSTDVCQVEMYLQRQIVSSRNEYILSDPAVMLVPSTKCTIMAKLLRFDSYRIGSR